VLDGDVPDDEDQLTQLERARKVRHDQTLRLSRAARRLLRCLGGGSGFGPALHPFVFVLAVGVCRKRRSALLVVLDGEILQIRCDLLGRRRLGEDSESEGLDDFAREQVGLLAEEVDSVKSLLSDSEPGKKRADENICRQISSQLVLPRRAGSQDEPLH
jgi:hypothetical protein